MRKNYIINLLLNLTLIGNLDTIEYGNLFLRPQLAPELTSV